MNLCFHTFGFPRRYKRYEERHNVDVQTCLTCGKQRVSKIQFGPEQSPKLQASVKTLNEEEAKA